MSKSRPTVRRCNLARASSLAVVAAAAWSAVGCGNSAPTDRQQVRNIVNRYTVALGENHLDAACALTAGSIHHACETVAGAGGLGAIGNLCQQAGGSDCAALVSSARATAAWTISKVVMSGNRATVAFAGNTIVMQLAKQHGRWRIINDQ